MARRTSVHPVTQEDEYSSDDGSDELPGLPYSTQELEQETYISLLRNQTLDGQIPAGPYILVLSKPTGEIMSDDKLCNIFYDIECMDELPNECLTVLVGR